MDLLRVTVVPFGSVELSRAPLSGRSARLMVLNEQSAVCTASG